MARNPALLSPAEAGAALGVTDATVREWIRLGRIPAVRLPSGRYKVRAEDVARLLDAA